VVGGEGDLGALRRRNRVNPRDAGGWWRGEDTRAPVRYGRERGDALSPRGFVSRHVPRPLRGRCTRHEPPSATCEGAQQRLGSGRTETSVKVRNKIGGQTISPLRIPWPLVFSRIPATYGTFAYTRVGIYRVFGDRSDDPRLRTEAGNRFLTGARRDVDRHKWEMNKKEEAVMRMVVWKFRSNSRFSASELTLNNWLELSRHLRSSFMRNVRNLWMR